MASFTVPRPQGFSLRAARDFFAGFIPGSGMAQATARDLTLVFRLDRTFEPAVVALADDETGSQIRGEVAGTSDVDAARRQAMRILGLDADGGAWVELGRRNPLVGSLQAEFPGFFTAAKSSPYDAAAWGVVAPRMNMRVAASLKVGIAEKHGDAICLRGQVHHVFPSPAKVLEVESFPRLPTEKVERLHAVAFAALEGRLDVDRLRMLGEERAMADLQTIRGVGPWTAGHIYFRGAAPGDALPTTEPRILHGLADALGVDSIDVEQLRSYAESWRPFRMWVSVLLSRHLMAAGRWKSPTLVRERAALGRAARGAPAVGAVAALTAASPPSTRD